ncbi:hypothetical protein BaRGS_00001765 [Batillaria attramentaria]|uniref:Uncharacterized protein n=1 Tax=Batillaria attramentaria TaxID=370345 RepID=A0ABD0M4S4_9CAEN
MKLKKTTDSTTDRLQCSVLWHFQTQEGFNNLCVDTVLRPKGLGIITGGEDGIIRIYEISSHTPSAEPQACVETKGGPIQCVAAHNVTRFGQNDLMTADSQGTLTVVCGQQILSRQSLASHALTCLQVQEDGRGYLEIVTGTERGLITACQASSQLWTMNLNDIVKVPTAPVSVRCLLGVELPDSHGHNHHYMLASDNMRRLHLILHGHLVMSLSVPAVITAMAQGAFFPASQLGPAGNPGSGAGDSKQVALGAANGSIYILYNMSVTAEEVARAESPITHLASLSLPDNPLDLLLCAGHFKMLSVYRQGELAYKHATSDWVNSVVTADVDGDGVNEVVIGCLDKTVTALKFS